MTGKPSLVDRLHRFFAAGRREAIQVRIVHDPRDRPPWTVEFLVDRSTIVVRSGATLQAALTATLRGLDEREERLRAGGRRPPLREGPGPENAS